MTAPLTPRRLHGDTSAPVSAALPTAVTVAGIAGAALAEVAGGAPGWLVALILAVTAAATAATAVLVRRRTQAAAVGVIDLRRLEHPEPRAGDQPVPVGRAR